MRKHPYLKQKTLLDVLIDVDDERWLEWHSEDQWHILLHTIIQQVINHIGFR